MIAYSATSREFHIATKGMSYIIKVDEHGHLLQLHYGARLRHRETFATLDRRYGFGLGNSVPYVESDEAYWLDVLRLEAPVQGKGDYREPAFSFRHADGTSASDLLYDSHTVAAGKPALEGLPSAFGDGLETLSIRLRDPVMGSVVTLAYTPFEDCDVIARSAKVANESGSTLRIERVMSMSLDYDHGDMRLRTLDGKWIAETQLNERPLSQGVAFVDSKKGVSGNYHNPFLSLSRPGTDETHGEAWGFGLVYSGNWRGLAELSPHGFTRVQLGINPHDFSWTLEPGESFQAPEALLSFSSSGYGAMSRNFHALVKKHLVPRQWQGRERPILINNWEATYFKFDEGKLLALARKAKEAGIELFVLDDGWFGKRNDDRTSLGDWFENRKKLPGGLEGLSRKIKAMGLSFGLWVEPEMVSVDSELYRAHPEWAVRHETREPSLGRHQLVLDLSNPEVTEHLYATLKELFSKAGVDYVKWDMNRNFSDVKSSFLDAARQAEFAHRYILGLYSLLARLVSDFPDILFESCASGGNRYDLGMLAFMPQTWASDDTDAVERVRIQHGATLAYPASTMGAHVSGTPSHQVLRTTPFETRFNVAAFGLLGYELDLTRLSHFETKAMEAQVAFYKEHRALLQFGDLYRITSPYEGNTCVWMTVSRDRSEAIMGYYQRLQEASPGLETYRLAGLDPDALYDITARPQFLNIRTFGSLIDEALPFRVRQYGLVHSIIGNRYLYRQEEESYTAYGDELMAAGWKPLSQFVGTGMGKGMHFMGDFGSRLYHIKRRS